MVKHSPQNCWIRLAFPAMVAGLLASSAANSAAASLDGFWTGYWQSGTTGHKGPLNATFCSINDSQYRVNFSGRFFKILPFRYSVTLSVASDDGQAVRLTGSSYLGRLFGTFRYRAKATESSFTAHYSSRKDCGQFVLCRVCVQTKE